MIARGTSMGDRLGAGRGPRRGLALNLTSMIDVVFLLVVFFMLVAHLSKDRLLALDLPRVGESARAAGNEDSRAVLNIVPVERVAVEGGAYRVGTLAFDDTPDGVRALGAALAAIRERDPATRVLVRAGRGERYERVRPALEAVSGAGISRVDLALVPISGEGRGP